MNQNEDNDLEFKTLTAAAGFLGISRKTVESWIRQGKLKQPPYTRQQLEEASAQLAVTGNLGPHAQHGSLTRWEYGCRCLRCSKAHTESTTAFRRKKRDDFWNERQDLLLEKLSGSSAYSGIFAELDITWQAVSKRAESDPAFKDRLDQALMEGRPNLGAGHGRAASYRYGCRCPECRNWRSKHG